MSKLSGRESDRADGDSVSERLAALRSALDGAGAMTVGDLAALLTDLRGELANMAEGIDALSKGAAMPESDHGVAA